MKTSTVLLFLSTMLAALVSKAGNNPVSMILPSYERTQEALSMDSLDGAQAAARQMAETAKINPELAEKTQLNGLSLKVAEAPDITQARIQFQKVTLELRKLIEVQGTGDKETVYLMYCPMANGGVGGTWLQTNDKVTNPYEGQKMLRCGSIKKTYDDTPPAKAEE